MIRSWPLTLPWDKPPLTMNTSNRGVTRGARMDKARTAADIRTAVCVLAKDAGIGPQPFIHVRLNYRPKDRRRRDADGLVATLKPCLDGIVDARIIPDDTPQYLDWSAPRIHPPCDNRTSLLWLTITTGIPMPPLSTNFDKETP